MSYFAELDNNNIVKRVIVADQEFIDSGEVGDSVHWVDTKLATNYPGIGYSYDKVLKYFIPMCPYPSWSFNRTKLEWESPVLKPQLFDSKKVQICNESKQLCEEK